MSSSQQLQESKSEKAKRYLDNLIPNNLNITPSELEEATKTLEEPGKIFIRYIRSAKTLMIEQDDGDDEKEYSLVNGCPIAVLVAFKTKNEIGDDVVLVGWAKRNQDKHVQTSFEMIADLARSASSVEEAADIICQHMNVMLNPKDVEVAFHKKAARRVAVLRAFTDQIVKSNTSSVVKTSTGVIIPRVVVRNLDRFLDDVERIFKGLVVDNVVIDLDIKTTTSAAA